MSDRITSWSDKPRMGLRVIVLILQWKRESPHSAHEAQIRSPGQPPCRRTTSALWNSMYIVKTALQPSLQNIELNRKNCRKGGAKAAVRPPLYPHLDTAYGRSYCPSAL